MEILAWISIYLCVGAAVAWVLGSAIAWADGRGSRLSLIGASLLLTCLIGAGIEAGIIHP